MPPSLSVCCGGIPSASALSPALLYLVREANLRPAEKVSTSPGHLLIVDSQSVCLAGGTELFIGNV